jgi:hypothetical protein
MGLTTNGLPYPEPADPVAAGADNIKALANAVDIDLTHGLINYNGVGEVAATPDKLLIQAKSVNYMTDYYGDFTLTFPVPFATGTQVVVVGSDANPSFRGQFSFRGPTLTNVSVNAVNADGSPRRDTAGNISYIAIGRRA